MRHKNKDSQNSSIFHNRASFQDLNFFIMKHTIAIIDSGGRGSVLVYKYAQSPHVDRIIAIPGNNFMHRNSHKLVDIYPHLKTTDVDEIVALCQKENVSLVDVAQDNAIAVGLVDALLKVGIPTVGPTKKAGELEWNKAFARKFMKKYKIPQPEFFVFSSQKAGIEFLRKQKDSAWFVKASGLCEGKGALPAGNNKEAVMCIKTLSRFGESAKTYLLEKWLQGKSAEEFSVFFLCDGKHKVFLGAAQDHKRAFNFDLGENTGGMGCVSSPGIMSKAVYKQVEEIAQKTIDGMRDEGRPYRGILYIGGMVIDGGVFVIEYNARWGDPEAQVILPSIQTDFFDLAMDTLSGQITQKNIKQDKKIRLVIAGAAKGYPVDYSLARGKQIFGLEKVQKLPHILLFGAGIKMRDRQFFVNGGRVFYIVSEGGDILQARERGYSAVSQIFIEGNNLHYRTDIGYRDVARKYQKV